MLNNKIAKRGFETILLFLVLLGGLMWFALGVFPSLESFEIYNHSHFTNRILYILIGLAAILLTYMNKKTYLPFLGITVLPENALCPSSIEDADLEVELEIPDAWKNTKYVVYWASNPNENVIQDPYLAYKSTENVGVLPINPKLKTIKVQLMCPSIYKVHGTTLPRHIHYRFASIDNIMSPVFTKSINC